MLFSSHNDKVMVHDNTTASDIADHLRMPIYAIKIVTLFVMYSSAYNELLRLCKILPCFRCTMQQITKHVFCKTLLSSYIKYYLVDVQ